MDETQTLKFDKLIVAPITQVYQSFTSAVALESWFSDFAELVPSLNGRFYAYWNAGHYAAGSVSELVENQHISFSWRGEGEPWKTEVVIDFKEQEAATEVRLQHTGLGTTADWETSLRSIQTGWEYALENLKSVLESGIDRRVYDRPLLGIYPNQLVDEELIKKYQLPIQTGVQISGVVENTGAQAAGLQADDVIFSINNHPLKGFNDFAVAIAGLNAGDVIEVEFYRGAHKYTVAMELSRRALPDIPDTPAALAEIVEKSYLDFNVALDKTFEGVGEEEAASHPGPREWSAKDTLVHLLYTERWLHLAISCAVSDQRTGGFVNQLELIRAIADSYTLPDLVAELKKCEQVTINSLVALPDEFVANKRKYTSFVVSFGQGFARHSKGHLPQIQAAITAARIPELS